MKLTRRSMVLGSTGILAGTTLAGCIGGDDEGEDEHDDNDLDDDAGDDEHDDDDNHDNEVAEEAFDHIGIEEFEILDRAYDPHEQLAYVHDDHWDGGHPVIEVDDNISLSAAIETEDGEELELGDEYELRVAPAHDAPEGIVEIDEGDYHGDHVYIHGHSEGLSEVVFIIWHDDHADYQSPPIDVQVVEDADEHDEHDHEDLDEVSEFQLLDRAHDPHEEISYVDGDHWHHEDDFPTIPIDDNVSIGAHVEDGDGHEVDLGHEFELTVRVADDAAEGIVAIDVTGDFHGDHVHIYGEEAGETEIVFEIVHDDHVDYESPPLAVEVSDE